MKRLAVLFAFVVLFSLVLIMAEEINNPTTTQTSTEAQTIGAVPETEQTSGQTTANEASSSNMQPEENEAGKEEFNVDAGMTPDNPLYFVDDLAERISVGNSPEKALEYKEEKIAEAVVMVDEGKPEEAQKVLDRALQYNDIVEREVSPEIQQRVKDSGERVQNVINEMRKETNGEQWQQVNEGFDENIAKEKKVGTAAELAAKINELCDTLAKLDPLQYADSCKYKGDSPNWMKEKDKKLTKEQEAQAKVFFDKLSACFEKPEACDCKGMGVQSFEDFCIEQSKNAVKCKNGDESACKNLENGADPSELLPDYLVSVMNKVQSKYSKAEMDLYMPEECKKAGVKTPEDCNQIMFKLNAPQECLDAGISGKSRQDEIKCQQLMFENNAPQECLDAGITASDNDAPRKCAKIMFQLRAPQECLDAGITGERRDDESRCRQLTGGETQESGNNVAKFNRDCKAIQDTNEKMKCYEEFYNNAQVQVKDDFRNREMTDQNTGEKITPEEESARQDCRNKGMGTILEYENGKRIVICVDKNQEGGGYSGQCQSQQQIENLKQDCKNRGQDAKVEDRGGCGWVICTGGEAQNQPYQQTQNRIEQSNGIKCPDGICDDYEKMNPYACPDDCGGRREQVVQQPQQPEGGCTGNPPSCGPGTPAYCQDGNWICPQPQQEQVQQSPQQPIQPQEPQEIIQPPAPQPEQPAPQQEQPAPSSEPAPVTGGIITGRVIVSNYGEENGRSGDGFLDYWFKR